MFVIKFDLLLLLTLFQVSHCERRIINGSVVSADKPYVVYLVKATISVRRYDTWLCGGALVSTEFIITSAACVEDVDFLYAIAGYRKYVQDKFIPHDECTETMKKKIVYTCVPVSYQFSFDELEKWSYIDIALVKVESPYNLNDARYQIMCSYIPSVIAINYDPKRQAAGVDGMVLGWGHTQFWRQRSDRKNHNQEVLLYTSVQILDKEVCKKEYTNYPDLVKTIDQFMICSLGPGNLNDVGEPIAPDPPFTDGCVTEQQKLMGYTGVPCETEVVGEDFPKHVVLDTGYMVDQTRKHMNNTNDGETIVNVTNNTGFINETSFVNETEFVNGTGYVKGTGFFRKTVAATRRQGICQNDHGGPLVTWVGTREVLIGIASVFKITEQNECVGPFLYTSTMCNGAFLSCVLSQNFGKSRRNSSSSTRQTLCDSPASVRGFDTIEKFVSWKDHPAGPAENEKDNIRTGSKKKGFDRFATNDDSEESEDNLDPLGDRHAPGISFLHSGPKANLSDRHASKNRFSKKIGPPAKNGAFPKHIDNRPKPVDNRQKPVDNRQKPINSGQKPINIGQMPINSGQNPINNRQNPINNRQNPINSGQNPVDNRQIPTANIQRNTESDDELKMRPQRPLRT